MKALKDEEYVSHYCYPDVAGVYEMDVPYAVIVNNDGSSRRVEKLNEEEAQSLRTEALLGDYDAPGGGDESDEISE